MLNVVIFLYLLIWAHDVPGKLKKVVYEYLKDALQEEQSIVLQRAGSQEVYGSKHSPNAPSHLVAGEVDSLLSMKSEPTREGIPSFVIPGQDSSSDRIIELEAGPETIQKQRRNKSKQKQEEHQFEKSNSLPP